MSSFWVFILLSISNCDYNITWNRSVSLPTALKAGFSVSIETTKSIYIVGYPQSAYKTIWKFDGKDYTKVGTNVCDNPDYNLMYASTAVQDTIYAPLCNVNSYLGNNILGFNTTSLKYDYNISIPPIHDTNLASLTSNDLHLFAILLYGTKKTDCQLSVMIYDIANGLWSKNVTSNYFSAEKSPVYAVYYDHNIYHFGCFTGFNSECMDYKQQTQILTFNDKYDKWTLLPVNITIAEPIGFMPFNGGIIYLFGYNETAETTNLWVYDTRQNAVVWQQIAISTRRDEFMLGVISDDIYIFGGNVWGEGITATTWRSSMIPTMDPTHSPTVNTKSPTHSPTEPTKSPSRSPTRPTESPTKSPTFSPTKVAFHFAVTEQNIIYLSCGIIGFLLCCCIGFRCYKKRGKWRNNGEGQEGPRYLSVDGVVARIRGHSVVDTSQNID